MSQVHSGDMSFTAGAAIAKHLRVKLASGVLAAAGVADKELGTALNASFASGDLITVSLRNSSGTKKMIAAGAIAVGADVYTAASGKVNDTAATTSYLLGTALEAAAADGDVIEVLPHLLVGAATA